MTQYFQDYLTVAVFAGFGFLLVLGAVGASALLRPRNPTATKGMSYECGMDPVGGDWSQTHVRFYIYGLLFFGEGFTLYTYYYGWKRMTHGRAKVSGSRRSGR